MAKTEILLISIISKKMTPVIKFSHLKSQDIRQRMRQICQRKVRFIFCQKRPGAAFWYGTN